MSNLFDKAIQYVLQNEGGYINDPNDAGGETNFGISQRFLYSHQNDPLCLITPKEMTEEIAKAIYFKYFWVPSGLELIADIMLVIKVFDFAVNSGIKEAIMNLQRAYNITYPLSEGLKIDSILGAKTALDINDGDSNKLLESFINFIISFYKELVYEHPSDEKFLTGWITRARKMPVI